MLQSQDHSSSKEFGGYLIKPFHALQMEEQFPTRAVFKNKIQLLLVLEGVTKTNDEWMIHAFKNPAFCSCMTLLLPQGQKLLFQNLHGK
jgi:hypothetical protein